MRSKVMHNPAQIVVEVYHLPTKARQIYVGLHPEAALTAAFADNVRRHPSRYGAITPVPQLQTCGPVLILGDWCTATRGANDQRAATLQAAPLPRAA